MYVEKNAWLMMILFARESNKIHLRLITSDLNYLDYYRILFKLGK